METVTVTLTDFLLARIAEDEGYAPKYHHAMCEWAMRGDRGATEDDCDCGLAARRKFHLAECEAKRRIVENRDHLAVVLGPLQAHSEWVCRTLALPYAHHPDYRPGWKP